MNMCLYYSSSRTILPAFILMNIFLRLELEYYALHIKWIKEMGFYNNIFLNLIFHNWIKKDLTFEISDDVWKKLPVSDIMPGEWGHSTETTVDGWSGCRVRHVVCARARVLLLWRADGVLDWRYTLNKKEHNYSL